MRIENTVSIILGGLISVLIMITAASSQNVGEEITSAKDLAVQLEPLFGVSAKWFMGIGLMAAGISSALTAPLAAAFAAKGLFNWSDDERGLPVSGGLDGDLSHWGISSHYRYGTHVLIIKFAQITNALLLPFIAIYLLITSNSKKILGEFTNGWFSNILAILVILITILLSLKTLNSFLYIF